MLFVCVGNSCRSQMAEGFAKKYGSDVLQAESAGLYPASTVSRLTQEVMAAKNIDVSGHFAKSIADVEYEKYHIVVNISGHMLPVEPKGRVLHWDVDDPIGADKKVFEETADQIEMLVQGLILELRKKPKSEPGGWRTRRTQSWKDGESR